MKRFFAAAIMLLWANPLAESGPESATEDAKLNAFFKKYLDEEFRRRPLEATRLGDHRFDHLLDDVSAKARSEWKERTAKTLADLRKEINKKKLSRSGQIDFEILQHHLTRELWLAGDNHPF